MLDEDADGERHLEGGTWGRGPSSVQGAITSPDQDAHREGGGIGTQGQEGLPGGAPRPPQRTRTQQSEAGLHPSLRGHGNRMCRPVLASAPILPTWLGVPPKLTPPPVAAGQTQPGRSISCPP